MIEYLVTARNYDERGNVRIKKLLDKKNEYNLAESQLSEDITDHIFDGTYTFTIWPTHDAYDDLHILKTIIIIEENGEHKFRGRPIKINVDKMGRKKVTCESDIHFLSDVPDVFSMRTAGSTEYKVGANINDVETPAGFFLYTQIDCLQFGSNNFSPDYIAEMVHDDIIDSKRERTAYTGLDGVKRTVWRIFNHKTIIPHTTTMNDQPVDPSSGLFREHQVFNFNFRREEVGKRFDVVVENQSNAERQEYRCVLRKFVPPVQPAIGGKFEVLYLGNINIVYDYLNMDTGSEGNYDQIKDGEDYIDIIPGTSELDWCITHVIPDNNPRLAYTWEQTIFYTTVDSYTGSSAGYRFRLLVKLTDTTNIDAMYKSILCPYFNDDGTKNLTMTGYNAYAPPQNRIYRGENQLMADLELTAVNSCFKNLQTWLQQTGGYAKIRRCFDENAFKDKDYYVLDLLKESGETVTDQVVEIGRNVTDYNSTTDISSLVTAIYPIGNADGEQQYNLIGKISSDGSATPSGTAAIVIKDGFKIDRNKNLVYNEEAVKNYGWAVQYKEYSIAGVFQKFLRQNLYEQTVNELIAELTAFMSFTVTAADGRLLDENEAAAVLGNIYTLNLPTIGLTSQQPLTKIVTDMIKASAFKVTFGNKIQLLSDYVAKDKIAGVTKQ